MEKMERRYGLPTAIATCVGIVIGSGIFFKTEAVAQKHCSRKDRSQWVSKIFSSNIRS